jgi:carboxyl-terminal processing protease
MSPRTRLFVAMISTGVISYLAVGSLLGRVMGDNTYGQLAVFNEVVRMVRDGYVEPVDLDRTLDGAQRGLVEALDGDSALLDGAEYRAWREGPAGDAEVGLALSRRYGFLMVIGVRAGSPAADAGMRPGDILKTIDGQHSRNLGAPVGERLLQGEPGSKVALEVLRGGQDSERVELSRERLAPVAPTSDVLEPGLGRVVVTEFDADTSERVRTELELLKRQGAESLVLDLRQAAFGDAEQGIALAQLFVESGVLARRDGRKVPEQVWNAEPQRVAWRGPLAVLIDAGTSGPGEVAAAALSGERAELVGRHTFGRAGVQKALPLPEGALVLTVAKYHKADGTPIHGQGLAPDVPVRRPAPGSEEEGDPVLEAAIEYLKDLPEVETAA